MIKFCFTPIETCITTVAAKWGLQDSTTFHSRLQFWPHALLLVNSPLPWPKACSRQKIPHKTQLTNIHRCTGAFWLVDVCQWQPMGQLVQVHLVLGQRSLVNSLYSMVYRRSSLPQRRTRCGQCKSGNREYVCESLLFTIFNFLVKIT